MTELFARERMRHEMAVRMVTVTSTQEVAPNLVRITFSSPELKGFTSLGPSDHVKMFFPDPKTGEFAYPVMTADGIKRPETGTVISRDYTPLQLREADTEHPELDIDFVTHGDNGPASAWASRAKAGDQLVIAGPRGSHLAPTALGSVVLVADESALPAISRWIDALDAELPVTGFFSVEDPETAQYLQPYAAPNRTFHWFSGADREQQRETAIRSHTIADDTFVYLAGESTTLIPLRRYLRRELALPREQVAAEGYWKRGAQDFDHHAPLDPEDPDFV